MKVSNIEISINNINPSPNFRSKQHVSAGNSKHDEFVCSDCRQKNNKKSWIIAGGITAALAVTAAICLRKPSACSTSTFKEFKNTEQAKKYFESLNINTEFCDVTNEHIPLLNRIKDDLTKLKELGVKIDKPNSLTISDWTKAEEYGELCRKRGISMERREDYFAFCTGDKNGKNHIFINAKKPETDVFRHEIGHANHHRGHDSFWEAKGIKNHDFADKQLEILGQDLKVYRNGTVQNTEQKNIFNLSLNTVDNRGVFATENGEARYVYNKRMLSEMQKETNCYKPDSLSEQVAYIFDGLVKGEKQYSDEVMLYYDFSGGARIPNLKINGKTYDEYIESLYNNRELIQKLRANIKISKI